MLKRLNKKYAATTQTVEAYFIHIHMKGFTTYFETNTDAITP